MDVQPCRVQKSSASGMGCSASQIVHGKCFFSQYAKTISTSFDTHQSQEINLDIIQQWNCRQRLEDSPSLGGKHRSLHV
jgi:hypothetical protein